MNVVHSQEEQPVLARVWGVAVAPTRGPRPKLSIEEVAARAIEIADADGLEAVTLARVAQACGVVTTGLYRYVASKAELIELMSQEALRTPPELDPSTPQAVQEWVAAFVDVLRAHPWLATIQPTGMPLGPGSLGWLDLLVRALTARGSEDVAGVALQISTTVRAYVAMDLTVTGPPPSWWTQVVQARFPDLVAAFAKRDLASPGADLDAALERILRR